MQILDNGIQLEKGNFRYLWFKIRDDLGLVRYRAIALRELTTIALDRDEPDDFNVLGKQQAALRGLYNAGVDFVYAAAGIFKPDHVGVVQFYGAAGDGLSLADAASQADRHIGAVIGVLSNYQQSQTRTPLSRWIEWYLEFVTHRAGNVRTVLGHPDPRQARKPLGLDGALPLENSDPAAEQNEMLFRGLAKLGEDFLFQITAGHLQRRELTQAMLRVAQEASNVASRRRGAISIGANLSIPIMAALSNSLSGGQSIGESQAQSETEGQSHNWGQAHTDSYAHTESQSHTEGESESHGIAVTHSEGRALTESEAFTKSHSVTEGEAYTQSSAVTNSRSETHSSGQYGGWSQSVGQSQSEGQTNTHGQSPSQAASSNNSYGANVGGQANVGIPGTVGAGINAGVSGQWGSSMTNSLGISDSEAQSQSQGQSSSQSVSGGWSSGHSVTEGVAVTRGSSHTQSRSETHGEAYTQGRAVTISEGEAITESQQWSKFKSDTWGRADTWGVADSQQEGWGKNHSQGHTQTQNQNRSAMQALTRGLSTGLIPGISINRSWQTEDDVADCLTEIYRQIEGLLNMTSKEGGFLGEAVLFTETETGASAGDALIPQAFHGPNSPTPVLTARPGSDIESLIRRHALAFTPHMLPDPTDPLHGALGGRFSTVLTMAQLAAYTAPAIFREGTVRIIPAIPKDGLGFYPDMPGDVLLGHQFSPETADLTRTPVKLDRDRFVHILFAGSTGFGKSVGAMRLAYEVALKWKMRVVVLDFGYAWRQLLNAAGIEEQVDIRQLNPFGVRPLRWNPMQISRHIHPEEQMKAFAGIFTTVAQLGVKQQQHRFLDAIEQVYLQAGVLTDDPKVRADRHWGRVTNQAEADAADTEPGMRLNALTPDQRQQIAIERSKNVGLRDLYQEIETRRDALPTRDQIGRGIYEGILQRLKSLIRGSAEPQFAPGHDAIDLADLGQSGVLILEGGQFLDKFSKAWLLGWAGWLISQDMVKKRQKQLISGDAELLLIFEEANKILTGLAAEDPNNRGGGTVAEQYEDLARDSRKYGIRLVFISQSPSSLPVGIRSSCSSLIAGFLSEPDDKDVILSALAKSEKGFRDEAWRRFLADEQIGMALGRLPYTFNRAEMRPFLFQPLILDAEEPGDEAVATKLGAIAL